MIDYDTIVATVQDDRADPILLAKIAYEHPEFGANVAVNPRAYPGLKRWIAQFGDQRARDTLAQMGFTASPDSVADRQVDDGGEAGPQAQRPEYAQRQQPGQASYGTGYGQNPQAQSSYAYAPSDQQAQAVQQQAQPAQQQPNYTQNPQDYAQPVQQAQGAAQASASAQNAYGFTAEQALDPNTDQMTIAKIAQYAPELRPCLARNPNTYPALLDWLAQLHDPAVDAALATRPR